KSILILSYFWGRLHFLFQFIDIFICLIFICFHYCDLINCMLYFKFNSICLQIIYYYLLQISCFTLFVVRFVEIRSFSWIRLNSSQHFGVLAEPIPRLFLSSSFFFSLSLVLT